MQKGTFHSTHLFRSSGLTVAEVKQALWLHSAGECGRVGEEVAGLQEANADPLIRSEVSPSCL